MRGYSGQWTGIGLSALLSTACLEGGGITASESQTGDDGTTEPGASGPSSQGEPTGPGQVTGQTESGSESDSEPAGSTTATTSSPQTGGPDSSTSEGTTATTGVDTSGSDSTTGDEPDTTSDTGVDTTGGDTGDEPCSLATMHLPCDAASDDPLHAIGLNCVSLGGEWNPNNATPIANSVLEAAPEMAGERAWQVARSYGSYVDPNTNAPYWGAREGEKVLLISSGLLPPPGGNGAVIVDDGDVYNDVAFGDPWDSDSMPPPMMPNKGSPAPNGYVDCDGTNDCSNTIWDQWQSGLGNAEDKMWFGFELTAPALSKGQIADANGYSFDFAYFSAEFPEFVGTEYNDIFVVWQASEDYTGNVTFVDGQPLTVTALWPIDFHGECDSPNCQGNDEHLEGTGYITDGGATGWYKATGGVNPGETFTLTFGIFDMGDSIYDTTAILDNWLWDCEGCVPNEVDSCGIAPQ